MWELSLFQKEKHIIYISPLISMIECFPNSMQRVERCTVNVLFLMHMNKSHFSVREQLFSQIQVLY